MSQIHSHKQTVYIEEIADVRHFDGYELTQPGRVVYSSLHQVAQAKTALANLERLTHKMEEPAVTDPFNRAWEALCDTERGLLAKRAELDCAGQLFLQPTLESVNAA